MWFIDRIAEKTPTHITFELASPFDLAGVSVPARAVVGKYCSWEYQGANSDLIVSTISLNVPIIMSLIWLVLICLLASS